MLTSKIEPQSKIAPKSPKKLISFYVANYLFHERYYHFNFVLFCCKTYSSMRWFKETFIATTRNTGNPVYAAGLHAASSFNVEGLSVDF